jgi:hypothetical protein
LWQIWIGDQFLTQPLSKIKHACLSISSKEHSGEHYVHFSYPKKESEDAVRPPLGGPCNLQANWQMPFTVVIINSMSVPEVVLIPLQDNGNSFPDARH